MPPIDPLTYLALTCTVYAGALEINRRFHNHPLVNPVLLSAGVLIVFLWFSGVDYKDYFSSVKIIHFFLGPAVVALAVPLFRHVDKVRRAAVPIVAGVIGGSTVSVSVTLAFCMAAGMDLELSASLSTKSVTAPVAMSIADHIGGAPALAAVFAVITGMLGAAFGPWLMTTFNVNAPMERGLAMGTTSHGQGAARILQEDQEAGAFAGLAMGLTALWMALVLPLAAWLVL